MKININEPIFDFPHTLREISIDITLTWIKVQDMKIAKWKLLKEIQIHPPNLGTHDEPQVVKLNVGLDPFIPDATKNCWKSTKMSLYGHTRIEEVFHLT